LKGQSKATKVATGPIPLGSFLFHYFSFRQIILSQLTPQGYQGSHRPLSVTEKYSFEIQLESSFFFIIVHELEKKSKENRTKKQAVS